MGVEQTTAITVTCDNPACPGNSLDSTTTNGWIEASSLLHGSTFIQASGIFCSPACASTLEQAITLKVEAEKARQSDLEGETQPELPEAQPTEKPKRTRAKKS